jgi:hypothetical protein
MKRNARESGGAGIRSHKIAARLWRLAKPAIFSARGAPSAPRALCASASVPLFSGIHTNRGTTRRYYEPVPVLWTVNCLGSLQHVGSFVCDVRSRLHRGMSPQSSVQGPRAFQNNNLCARGWPCCEHGSAGRIGRCRQHAKSCIMWRWLHRRGREPGWMAQHSA